MARHADVHAILRDHETFVGGIHPTTEGVERLDVIERSASAPPFAPVGSVAFKPSQIQKQEAQIENAAKPA